MDGNPNVYILNEPPLLANTYLSLELLLSRTEFESERTYAALADDGTYFGYPEGDTPNETKETLDISTNNIFIWTMPYYELEPEPPTDPGTFPNYDRFTIVNQSAGSYNFDDEDYAAFVKWNDIITALPQPHITYNTKLTININIGPMDANTLGYTQIDDYYYDGASSRPYVIKTGTVVFNESLVSTLKSQIRNGNGNKSTFYYMLLHELGHVFGLGALFSGNNIQISSGGTSWYNGANGVREYKSYFPQYTNLTYIPIENDGGGGTAGVHLEEGNEGSASNNNRSYNGVFHPGLDHELMTGWSDGISYPLPLSRITIACMEDLGYSVDYTKAEFYDPANPYTLS